MSNLYDALVALLREHWKNHDNAYPQRIELNAADLQALNAQRKLVNESMHFVQEEGWEGFFHGTPLQAGEISCLVDVQGKRIPISLAAAAEQAPKNDA